MDVLRNQKPPGTQVHSTRRVLDGNELFRGVLDLEERRRGAQARGEIGSRPTQGGHYAIELQLAAERADQASPSRFLVPGADEPLASRQTEAR